MHRFKKNQNIATKKEKNDTVQLWFGNMSILRQQNALGEMDKVESRLFQRS